MTIAHTEKETITTVGVVIPVEWEETGRPIAFALASHEEKEYLIDLRTRMGKKLAAIEKQKIRVTGTLGRFVKKRRVISVQSYEQFHPNTDS
jgi:hypothetical protein